MTALKIGRQDVSSFKNQKNQQLNKLWKKEKGKKKTRYAYHLGCLHWPFRMIGKRQKNLLSTPATSKTEKIF